MERRTRVVQGALAYGMSRVAVARAGETGTQIMTLPQLAARLAGGFLQPATGDFVDPAIRSALDEGGFQDLENGRRLPGMTRAVARTLRKAGLSDFRLHDQAAAGSARIADLLLIEQRVKRLLPPAVLLPGDLRDAALERVALAPAVLGPVRIEGAHFIDPVWRPLLNALCAVCAVEWHAPPVSETGWFHGPVTKQAPHSPEIDLVTCADPRHEALEALRWARSLLASGRAQASEIAISSVTTEEWDDHIFSLAAEAGLRVHFPHGMPCLATPDGQRCAALADVLLNGLTQARVRRLFALIANQGTALDALPAGWLTVPRGASLTWAAEWARALDASPPADFDPKPVVLPLLSVLEQGLEGAEEAAAAFLRGRSRRLWDMATRSAPAAALELSLRTIRVQDDLDAGDSIVWCPAWQLAAAPRCWVRLLGLTSRGWPRRYGEDPVLPGHIVRAGDLDSDPPAEADRRAFEAVTALAAKGAVLSRSRRNAQGGLTGASPLIPARLEERVLPRARLPDHALTVSDRLTARHQEAAEMPLIKSGVQCWRDWHTPAVTAHDGLVQPGHPVLLRTLARVQSATSLTRLLRDPLGFVWRYTLGWQAPPQREQPLTLAADEFGRLVHELLRRTVDALEPVPGFTAARADEIEAALEQAVRIVLNAWPLERPVPPHVLWVNTVRQAAQMSLAGLTLEAFTEAGTRSWTEVPFGQGPDDTADPRDLPWDPAARVTVPGTVITIRGTIDRLDLRADGIAVRVTDYKTGERPGNAAGVVIGGGAELQRTLYALTCRQLLPDTLAIRARLIYLRDTPAVFPLPDPDQVFEAVSKFVTAACASLEAGMALPGVGAEVDTNDMRLALPVSPGYFRRKRMRFRDAAGALAGFWSAR